MRIQLSQHSYQITLDMLQYVSPTVRTNPTVQHVIVKEEERQ